MSVDKTKLNVEDTQHQILISVMATFVDDFGYTPRELYQLMNHAQNQLWPALAEMARERKVNT